MTESPRRAVLAWVAVAFIVRVAYLLEQQNTSVLFYQPLLDELESLRTAQQLIAGGGFGSEPFFKAPLYGVLMAAVIGLTGEAWYFALRLLQHALGAILVGIGFDTAWNTNAPGRSRAWASHVTAALLAFNGALVRLEHQVILDFLAMFFFGACLWALVRSRTAWRPDAWRWALTAGIAAALGWLTRPTITLVVPFLAAWILGAAAWRAGRGGAIRRDRLRQVAAFIAPIAVAMILVVARNAVVGGVPMLMPWQGGYNFYYANGKAANGQYLVQTGFSMAESGNPTRELAVRGFLDDCRARGVAFPQGGALYPAVDDYWFARAKAEIAADPARWLGLMARKLVWLGTQREVFNFEAYEIQRDLSSVLRVLPIGFGIVWPLALASLVAFPRACKSRRWRMGLMWLVLGTMGGSIALYYVSGRLRMPLVFPAAVLAGCGVAAIATTHSVRTRAIAGVLALLGIAHAWGDWWGVRSTSQAHAEYARLSNAAFRSGDFDRALGFADDSLADLPNNGAGVLLRAQALYGLERFDEARATFEQAAQLLPQDPVAPFNLGILEYYHGGTPERAVAHFRDALSRQPRYRQAAWMLALSLARSGRTDGLDVLLKPDLPLPADAPVRLLAAAAIVERTKSGDAAARALLAPHLERLNEAQRKELAEELSMVGFGQSSD